MLVEDAPKNRRLSPAVNGDDGNKGSRIPSDIIMSGRLALSLHLEKVGLVWRGFVRWDGVNGMFGFFGVDWWMGWVWLLVLCFYCDVVRIFLKSRDQFK